MVWTRKDDIVLVRVYFINNSRGLFFKWSAWLPGKPMQNSSNFHFKPLVCEYEPFWEWTCSTTFCSINSFFLTKWCCELVYLRSPQGKQRFYESKIKLSQKFAAAKLMSEKVLPQSFSSFRRVHTRNNLLPLRFPPRRVAPSSPSAVPHRRRISPHPSGRKNAVERVHQKSPRNMTGPRVGVGQFFSCLFV